MSWIRGTATNYLTLSDAIVNAATDNSVATVGISSGGSSYVEGDILTVVGGTGTVTAQIEVTSVAAGVIDGVRIYNAGVYTSNPSTPNSVTGGSGSAASLTLTFTAGNGWTANRDTTYSGSEKDVMLEGEGGGSDAIHVAWRTFSDVPTGYYNWELHGMTGYSSGQDTENQPGVSPGFFDAGLAVNRAGAYLLLHNASIQYWVSVTPYRIILKAKIGSAYFNSYFGWGNRFHTVSEYPYPLCVAGHASNPFAIPGGPETSGLVDPWHTASGEGSGAGPMFVRFTDGQWYSVTNGTPSGVSRDRVVMPAGRPSGMTDGSVEAKNKFFASVADFEEIIPGSGASIVANLHPTPGLTDDAQVILPATIVFFDPSAQIVMELDDVFWTSGFGSVVSEDRLIIGGVVYRVFQNCSRADNHAFLAIKEV